MNDIESETEFCHTWEPSPGQKEIFLDVEDVRDLSKVADEDSLSNEHFFDVLSLNHKLVASIILLDPTVEPDDVEDDAWDFIHQLEDSAENLNATGEGELPPMYEYPVVIAPLAWSEEAGLLP